MCLKGKGAVECKRGNPFPFVEAHCIAVMQEVANARPGCVHQMKCKVLLLHPCLDWQQLCEAPRHDRLSGPACNRYQKQQTRLQAQYQTTTRHTVQLPDHFEPQWASWSATAARETLGNCQLRGGYLPKQGALRMSGKLGVCALVRRGVLHSVPLQ